MTMLWIPKQKELVVEFPTLRPRLKGFFKLEAIRPDGRVRPLTGWFPNLITDVGLNRIGQGSYLGACHVGTNNTAPANGNTGLAGYLAGTTTIQASSYDAQATEPYYGWKRLTFRFAEGVATGNIAEVAIANQASNPGSVNFSRALVLDEFGAPAAVTVLSDEVLDVTYELRLYPPLVDATGTITITGSGSHNYTARASAVTSGGTWAFQLGSTASLQLTSGVSAHNGAIGAITGSPSGTSASVTAANAAYGSNNLYRDATASFGLNLANLSGGIRSIRQSTTLGAFQYELDPVIDKTDTKVLTLTHRLSWARYVP